jgi:nicotinamide/nicotinate riboside kinase
MPRLIGIGGSSCSGKSTVTDWLSHLLSVPIVHQDGFFRPDSVIPQLDGVANWDCPESIDFDEFHASLHRIKSGSSEQILGPNRPEMQLEELDGDMLELVEKLKNQDIVLVDGFLLFNDDRILDLLDVAIFLKAPFEILKARRESRSTYVTPEGHWQDPPGYFEKIVWPMYLEHNGKVLQNQIDKVTVIDSHVNSKIQVLKRVLDAIISHE